MVLRVAVIGAGAAGLPAIKCCLDEGLEPVCFESTGHIGGLWQFTTEVTEGQASVTRTTVMNTSKEMMCFSDFPVPKEFSSFMHHSQMLQYLHQYADKFNLKQYIQFHTEVVSVKRTSDFKNTGRWEITYRYRKDSSTDSMTEIFDAVLVCTGHLANKKMPSWPGMEKFKGIVSHTHDYKDFKGYEDKRVVVVGTGNSGLDVAVDLCHVASKVFLSKRRGFYIISRYGHQWKPVDMILATRSNFLGMKLFPKLSMMFIMRKLDKTFEHGKFGFQSKHELAKQIPSINDDLPSKILSGAVSVKGNIKELTENEVVFEDGSNEDADAIVLATGYVFGFPFLEKEVVNVVDNKVNLFKYMYPPDLEHNTMAIIGCVQPLGAIMPIAESQCRLAVRVFKGDLTLPSREEMWSNIRLKHDLLSKRYVASSRHTIQEVYLPFMDEIAELNGHKPNLVKLFFTDPQLWWEVFFGPATSYQYRMHGPGAWDGAREMIMTQWDRTFHSLGGRKIELKAKEKSFSTFYVIAMAAIAILLYMLFFDSLYK